MKAKTTKHLILKRYNIERLKLKACEKMPTPKKSMVNSEGRDVSANGYPQGKEGKEQESRRITKEFTGKKVIMLQTEEDQNL